MPGFADSFEDDKLFQKSIALSVALKFCSADAIRTAGVNGIASYLNHIKVRFHVRTIERIVAWASTAIEPSELAAMHTRQWQELDEECTVCSTLRSLPRNEKWRVFSRKHPIFSCSA